VFTKVNVTQDQWFICSAKQLLVRNLWVGSKIPSLQKVWIAKMRDMLKIVFVNSGGHNSWILKSRDIMPSMPMIVKIVTILGSCNCMVCSYSCTRYEYSIGIFGHIIGEVYEHQLRRVLKSQSSITVIVFLYIRHFYNCFAARYCYY
jgi:hypothetical protein